MSELFLTIVNMSISASWLALAVIILRVILKKMPKWLNPVLWSIVGIRLIMPFSIESALSLIPSAEPISPQILYSQAPVIDSGISAVNNLVNPIFSKTFAPNPGASVNPLQILVSIVAVVWCVGIVLMVLYTIFTYFRLRNQMKTAVPLGNNLYQSDHTASPFVLGFLRPRIYLPIQLTEKDRKYVVAHEQAHIQRRDHWWKILGFLLLSLHWFNPILWAAYILFCRDIELACDEQVIQALDTTQRADYSEALLTCSAPRRQIAACPLAFGEVSVKERVINVLKYKKPAMWIVASAVLACIAVALCFLTNPKTAKGHEAFALTFPVSDSEKTEYNQEIFEISPFRIQFDLPTGWSIGEYTNTEAYYLYSGLWSRVGIYDENNQLVGAVGYNICDDEADLEVPMSVYHQISLGNHYQFNIHDTYEIIKKTGTAEIAVADVYISAALKDAEEETINRGIVACDIEKGVYVAFELDCEKSTEEQRRSIVESLDFVEE